MDKGALLAVGGAVAFILLARREARADTTRPAKSDGGKTSAPAEDREWQACVLSEYYPDAPADEKEMEGGRYDRNPRQKTLVITVQQHQSDPEKYPYVSVSGDVVLRGKAVPYGARIYFGIYPDITFRLVDTGQRFYGAKKRIKDGIEPFDIATNYGSKLGFAGRKTVYRIDRSDKLSMYTPKTT